MTWSRCQQPQEGWVCREPCSLQMGSANTSQKPGPCKYSHSPELHGSAVPDSGWWQPLTEEKPQHHTSSWLFLFPSQGCTLSFADRLSHLTQPRLACRSLSLQSEQGGASTLFMQRSSLLTSPPPRVSDPPPFFLWHKPCGLHPLFDQVT